MFSSTSRVLCFGLVLFVAACGRTPNPDVCCVSQADCNALGVDEPVRACADGLVCEDHACVPPICELDVDCAVETPFCDNGLCVACRDSSDCSVARPVCDESIHSCRACVVDTDCDSNVCNFDSGACIAASEVFYASPSGTNEADCSQQQPCAIVKAVDAANIAKSTVRLLPGVYNAALQLDGPISIHGDGATLIASTASVLFVIDAADARIYGLTVLKKVGGISSQDNYGVLCQSSDQVNVPKLALERVVIEAEGDVDTRPVHMNRCILRAKQTTLRAPTSAMERYLILAADNGAATFDRSRFIGGGGIAAVGANITITNSVLDRVGGKPTEGALLAAFGSVSLAYSTIYESALVCQMGGVPACSSAAREGVCIENSLITRPSVTDAINGDKCRCDYCMVSPQQAPVVGSNNTSNAFLSMANPTAGDFHLVAGSDAIDAAHPSITGTPDFDGTTRPQGPRSDVGAFEFKE